MAERDPRHPRPHHHGPDGPESLGALIGNLRGTGLPWRRVLALVARNFRVKITSLRGCCGNYGQPGC